MKTKISLILGLVLTVSLNSQNLEKQQWENRVILIVANDSKSEIYNAQIKEFSKSIEDFKDRKLLIYNILPTKYKIENNPWVKNSKLYKKHNPNHKNFSIILIGLDGNVKIEQFELLTVSELFSLIDSMPMRLSGLRKKG